MSSRLERLFRRRNFINMPAFLHVVHTFAFYFFLLQRTFQFVWVFYSFCIASPLIYVEVIVIVKN